MNEISEEEKVEMFRSALKMSLMVLAIMKPTEDDPEGRELQAAHEGIYRVLEHWL